MSVLRDPDPKRIEVVSTSHYYRGLRLVGTEIRNRNQDKWAIEEVKGFSAIDFRGFGENEQTSTFLFLPVFVPALSDRIGEIKWPSRLMGDASSRQASIRRCRSGEQDSHFIPEI